MLLLPDGEDPDSFARKHSSAEFIEFVQEKSTDFIRFKTNLLIDDAGNDPVKRASLILDIVRSIAIIPNQVIRAEYVKDCSSLLKVEEAMLYHEINKLKTAEREKTISRESTARPAENTTAPKTSSPETGSGEYAPEERNILQTLLRFGKEDVRTKDDKRNNFPFQTVADYIYDELNSDELSFDDPVHQKILSEYERLYKDEQFNAEKHFLYHADEQVARLTTDLVTDKYTLSKIHSKMRQTDDEDKMSMLAKRVIYEYKSKLLHDIIKEKLILLKTASENKNPEEADAIMLELKDLDKIKRELAKELGERIITKF